MREYDEPPNRYAWIVYAIATMMVGAIAGSVMAIQGGRSQPAPTVAAQAVTTEAMAISGIDESELRAYRDILARDPNNAQAAVKAGNLLYDAQRYIEAIGFYQQAFALLPADINVSTDLGTALWYAGRAEEALAQYQKSLAINPTHAQTLFNIGIVRNDGTHDYSGAIAAWETLLDANPAYPEAARVRSLLSATRLKIKT